MIAVTRATRHAIAARMEQAVSGLTHLQRQALYLTAVDQKPTATVARLLDLPEEVVETLATAARRKVYEQVAA